MILTELVTSLYQASVKQEYSNFDLVWFYLTKLMLHLLGQATDQQMDLIEGQYARLLCKLSS